MGTVTHSTLQMGLGLAAILAGLGVVFLLTGGGVVWAARSKDDKDQVPDTIPEAMLQDPATPATVA